VLDADAAAREVLAPGTAGLAAVEARFGPGVLAGDGSLDRAALARVVFRDASARRELEQIVHPAVVPLLRDRLAELRRQGAVGVAELPLLVDATARARYGLDGVLLVHAPEDLALERLAERGMDPDDARARIAAQPGLAERLAAADFVILNVGSPAELGEMVNRAWSWIVTLREGRRSAEPDGERTRSG
jgi:dephospho-CoA kinase